MKRKGLAKMFMMILKGKNMFVSWFISTIKAFRGSRVKCHMHVPRDITFNTMHRTKNDTSRHNKDILLSL